MTPPLRFATAGVCLAVGSAASAGSLRVSIDAGDRHQTIEGFGASIPGFAPFSDEKIRSLSETFTRDLGASILRIDMYHTALHDRYARTGQPVPREAIYADASYATPVALDGTPAENAAKFDMDAWRVGIYGRFAGAMHASRIDDFKVIGTVWSPPIWMKEQERGFDNEPRYLVDWVDGEAIPRLDGLGRPIPKTPFLHETNVVGGSLIDTAENRAEFGRFVAGYTRAFGDRWGVELDAVSFANEPRLSTFYGSTVYSPDVYARTLVDVAAELERAGLDTELFGPETVGSGDLDDPGSFWQTMRFVDAVRETPGALAALDAYAVHGYDASGVGAAGAGGTMWRQLQSGRTPADNKKADGTDDWLGYVYRNDEDTLYGPKDGLIPREGLAVDGKPLWMTETSGQADVWTSDAAGDGGGAMGLAASIHHALVDGDVSAYVYWLFADGNPGLSPSQAVNGEDTGGANYNALKHFFRHVRPGAVRVGIDGGGVAEDAGVLASAFVHEAQGTLTLVLVNTSAEEEAITLDLASLQLAATVFERFASDAQARFAHLNDAALDEEGLMELTLRPHSVTTLVGSAAVPEPAVLGLLGCGLAALRRRR
ncbi:glycoside hydrolase family 30 beta sandwich domain-containing protein [Phycisphaera mikurensis]|uniref:Glycosyl hydrolase family 30 beta sandwich domain-containing protein n=1 Tax=Phycisphaera mikurensis (strain NBRC 102666 / KCTC 22515 / FYK2301M01) TaxID=1142394 RepID=I0IGI1_PHYMF|nr:glycoside hydrolase family 30 beta sandwich domain-containing protein [Phycisphaera mikurensis]MBB6442950.1 O-glycosyl hydrolase [Phycisphaera mikurensis]BAM04369.1 hypothetical protein PSMK_22100 [Phycisphaera mikurensis NBRC 102666]